MKISRPFTSTIIFAILLFLGNPPEVYAGQSETIDETQIGVGLPTYNLNPFVLQTTSRMRSFFSNNYSTNALKKLMQNENANIYNRYCAAYFLMRDDAVARAFIENEVRSENLRHRYNAANILSIYASSNPDDTRATNLLIKLIADGSLDGSGVTSSPRGNFPDGDRDDIMYSPLDDICRQMGNSKKPDALDALISVAERLPLTFGVADALGEIGNPKAIPVLLKIAGNPSEDRACYAVTALGELKAKEAVPILISRLGIGKKYAPNDLSDGIASMGDEKIIEALLKIGDSRAIAPLEKYIAKTQPIENKGNIATAKRALAQLQLKDPVPRLIELYNAEDYEPSKSDILWDLVKYPNARVITFLREQATQSGSAFLRRVSITRLAKIPGKEALMQLAGLLDVAFPKNLKAEWGWKGSPDDFSVYFPRLIADSLKEATRQDFGLDKAQWQTWIEKNIQN